ncbi:MAG: ATP-binding protein [Streptomyces sp.]|jgi:anti-sigma regulatory factor (Ser/Thr protein kinase)|uniref:ATP-binding protein n=1 Tax=Streptomyces sp. TaxID=1931 RepID=UPI0025E6A31F|nr:ATP-binding protein [Streptomyces sp.]MBW8792552.1 ATP-binding protein [Streptomyces sp.]
MNPELQTSQAREAFYRRDRRSVGMARDFTRTALADWRVGRRADDVLLCVSEVTTNAVLHGVPPGRGFRLRLALHPDGVLRTEVHDSGPGELRYGDMSPESEQGRGLLLVALLADKWGVGEREPGKVVWCEFEVRE